MRTYMFDKGISKQVSALASMPNAITDIYFPTAIGTWGEYLASALCREGGTVVHVWELDDDISNEIVDLSEMSIADLLHGNFDLHENPFVLTPSLIGKSFELMQVQEERELPDDIIDIAKKHEEKLLWLRADVWQSAYENEGLPLHVPHSTKHMDVIERNIESVIYVARAFRRKGAPTVRTKQITQASEL